MGMLDRLPKSIPCRWCNASETFRSTASVGSFDIHGSYSCRQCGKINNLSVPILDNQDFPAKAKCPKCGRYATATEATESNRVLYEHRLLIKLHQFELEYRDAGWGTYQGRAEIVRVYETVYDCPIVPG